MCSRQAQRSGAAEALKDAGAAHVSVLTLARVDRRRSFGVRGFQASKGKRVRWRVSGESENGLPGAEKFRSSKNKGGYLRWLVLTDFINLFLS